MLVNTSPAARSHTFARVIVNVMVDAGQYSSVHIQELQHEARQAARNCFVAGQSALCNCGILLPVMSALCSYVIQTLVLIQIRVLMFCVACSSLACVTHSLSHTKAQSVPGVCYTGAYV